MIEGGRAGCLYRSISEPTSPPSSLLPRKKASKQVSRLSPPSCFSPRLTFTTGESESKSALPCNDPTQSTSRDLVEERRTTPITDVMYDQREEKTPSLSSVESAADAFSLPSTVLTHAFQSCVSERHRALKLLTRRVILLGGAPVKCI
jgi:hypothetical protein